MTQTIDRLLMEKAGFMLDETSQALKIGVPQNANIAADTVGLHAHGPRRDHPALIFESADGAIRQWTFAEVEREATNLAAALRRRGVFAKRKRVDVLAALPFAFLIQHPTVKCNLTTVSNCFLTKFVYTRIKLRKLALVVSRLIK